MKIPGRLRARTLTGFLVWSLLLWVAVGRIPAGEELETSQIAQLIKVMSQNHLKKPKLDVTLIKHILDAFLNRLDPTHSAYLQGEAEAKTQMTDEAIEELSLQIQDGNFAYFQGWIKEFNEKQLVRDQAFFEKLPERKAEILFQYKKKDYEALDFNKFAKDLAERERRVFLRAHSNYRMYREWLSEQDALQYALQTLRQLRETTKFDPEKDFGKVFMKAYMSSLDPHSEYLDAEDIENFETGMARSFAGIGVQIRGCPMGAQVQEVIKGGPAIKSNEIEPGDQIIQVEDAILAGESLSKIVKLIKGEKGTSVKLTIKKAKAKEGESATKVVKLERDTINLAELRVTGERQNTDLGPVGVIHVQSFYQDVASDVAQRIRELNQPTPLAGMVLDLRGNSGGLLKEAIRMAGLFITEGPVVAEVDSENNQQWNADEEKDIAFTGPLAVLVNQFSASASEIVAGALKDYGRAVIVGPTQTHGKGTVQRIVDLRKYGIPGEFKLTIRQYFLAAGDSVQWRGVVPDVTIPGGKLLEDLLERSDKLSIPWARIEGKLKPDQRDVARFKPLRDKSISELADRSRKRVEANKDFDLLRQLAKNEDKEEGPELALAETQPNKPSPGDPADPAKKSDATPATPGTPGTPAAPADPNAKNTPAIPGSELASGPSPAGTPNAAGGPAEGKEKEKGAKGNEKEKPKDIQMEETVQVVRDMVELWSRGSKDVARVNEPEKAVPEVQK